MRDLKKNFVSKRLEETSIIDDMNNMLFVLAYYECSFNQPPEVIQNKDYWQAINKESQEIYNLDIYKYIRPKKRHSFPLQSELIKFQKLVLQDNILVFHQTPKKSSSAHDLTLTD